MCRLLHNLGHHVYRVDPDGARQYNQIGCRDWSFATHLFLQGGERNVSALSQIFLRKSLPLVVAREDVCSDTTD